MGTEDRVSDPSKKVLPTPISIAFVTFSGNDIKDLYVHEKSTVTASEVDALPPVPPSTAIANDKKVESESEPPKVPVSDVDQADKRKSRNNVQNNSKKDVKAEGTAGTGAHLLNMREKRGSEASKNIEVSGEFDFEAGLNIFKKEEVLAKVAKEKESAEIAVKEVKYVKDDFFDSLSGGLNDRKEGNRLTHSQERVLNQDTFGAVALQSNYRRGGGYRGGGGGGGRGGRGGGGRGYGGRNSNNNYNNNNSGGGGGRGRGRRPQNNIQQPAPASG